LFRDLGEAGAVEDTVVEEAGEVALSAGEVDSAGSAAAVPVVVGQAAAGRRKGEMVPEDKLDTFVRRLRDAAGPNLESVILYGSAASGDFDPEFSNLNVFCVLRDASFSALRALEPSIKWWDRQKQPTPLVMTREELLRSTDVFTIELMDMREHHRILFGEDVLQNLQIPTRLHRIQVEYELREKLILIRQRLSLASTSERQLWDLLLRSLPSFVTLFRHALIALGVPAPSPRRETVQALSKQVGFDPAAVNQVLNIRERKADRKQFDVRNVFAGYLAVVEQVTAAVDKMLDSDTSDHL
jgi:hypothetical protein